MAQVKIEDVVYSRIPNPKKRLMTEWRHSLGKLRTTAINFSTLFGDDPFRGRTEFPPMLAQSRVAG